MKNYKTGTQISKAKYWTAVLYPENMIDNWEDEIAELLQLPGAYCIHDKDLDNARRKRKTHVHIILAFKNTTTYNYALSVFDKLSKPDKSALNKVEAAIDIRHLYEYLIHNTADSKKKKKHLYDETERIEFNSFDIGNYEQLSARDKDKMLKELCDHIVQNNISNFADFYCYAVSNFGDEYFEVIKTYSGFLERLTKGIYLRAVGDNYQPYQIGTPTVE
jgi:hypothetical protein